MSDRTQPIRILVTGREGQVARALAERCAALPDVKLLSIGRPEFDFAKPELLAMGVRALAPDVVVNAAAYTAVDKAEDEPELAETVNAVAAGEVAKGAALANAPIIQISTDYVFDGTLDRPYRETDPVAPLGVYGRTKFAGEEAVAAAAPHHVILRTAWVYSPFGSNFVKTMLRLAKTKGEISVVNDQRGNPTSAFDIADAILAVVRKVTSADAEKCYGLYHFAGSGSATWCEFARTIFDTAGKQIQNRPNIRPIGTAEYPTPAARPANSMLNAELFARTFVHRPPNWRESLAATMQRLT